MSNNIYTIKPNWEIWVYPFLNSNKQLNKENINLTNIDYWTNSKAFYSPVKVPMEYISSFEFNDSIDSSDFKIEIQKGMYIIFKDKDTKELIALDELFSIGHIVVFKENNKIKFVGYILKRSRNEKSSGTSDFIISGSGIEGLIERQLLTIDLMAKYYDNNTTTVISQLSSSNDLNKFQNQLSGALSTLTSAISKMRSPDLIIRRIFKEIINGFLKFSLFGGYLLDDLINYEKGLSSYSYTKNLVHSVSWLSQANFGNQINYWNILESLAQPPLYELFFHYNEDSYLFIDEDTIIHEDDFTDKQHICFLVFRKTPFYYLHDFYSSTLKIKEKDSSNERNNIDNNLDNIEITDNQEYNYYYLPFNHIIEFDLEDNLDDIFTGIKIDLPAFESKKANKIIEVVYNPDLLSKFGQRVLNIKLEGVSFQKVNKTDPDEQGINNVKALQDLLYKHFGKGQKIVSGTILIDYHRNISKGHILRITHNDFIKQTPVYKILERYMPEFYIQGIRTTCNIQNGECYQNIIVKWGEIRTRKKDEINPVYSDEDNKNMMNNNITNINTNNDNIANNNL